MEEDSPATAAMGAEVLLGGAGEHGQSHGPMLTRRMALLEFAFLMEPPHSVIMHMLDQVMMSKLAYQLIGIQHRMSFYRAGAYGVHAAHLSYFEDFLNEAPCTQAQTVSGGHQAGPQMLAALRMLRAVFGSPGNPLCGRPGSGGVLCAVPLPALRPPLP